MAEPLIAVQNLRKVYGLGKVEEIRERAFAALK